jgi:hypothetical protein
VLRLFAIQEVLLRNECGLYLCKSTWFKDRWDNEHVGCVLIGPITILLMGGSAILRVYYICFSFGKF